MRHERRACPAAGEGTQGREGVRQGAAQSRQEHDAAGEHDGTGHGSLRGGGGRYDQRGLRGLRRAGACPRPPTRPGSSARQPERTQGREGARAGGGARVRALVPAGVLPGFLAHRGGLLEGQGAAQEGEGPHAGGPGRGDRMGAGRGKRAGRARLLRTLRLPAEGSTTLRTAVGDNMMDRNAASSRMDRGAQGAQAEWLGAMQSLAEQIQKQQQYSQQMTQELMNTYMQLLNTPGSYLSGQAEQQQTIQQTAQQWMEQAQQQQQTFQEQVQEQQQSFQQMTQEVLGSYSKLFNIPLSYAKEGLRDAQFPIEGYDELNVEEVSGRLDALSTEDLREVRDYEERTKNRETILEQLDRRIRSTS